jgi:DNA modification methylase
VEEQRQRGNRLGAFCLRCSAWRGSLGLEPSVDLFVKHLVQVFREVRRVLRADGTCWLVIGDSYSGAGYSNHANTGGATREQGGKQYHTRSGTIGLKPKDLCMIPARVALALQADGWWIRSHIAWAKGISFLREYSGSVMPESVSDRPTNSWESVFLLAKSERYFWDAEAVKESASENTHSRGGGIGPKGAATPFGDGIKNNQDYASAIHGHVVLRNLRSVWAINPEPYPDVHFATFPQALVTPMVKAGTSAAGACARCGAPWTRITQTHNPSKWAADADARGFPEGHTTNPQSSKSLHRQPGGVYSTAVTLGWRPTCACGPEVGRRPCIVLDPFAGSGTVPLVAQELGRIGIGVDLQPDYLAMAGRRTAQSTLPLLEGTPMPDPSRDEELITERPPQQEILL